MVIEKKESFEKTRRIKNNDKFKKYILRGQRNTRYQERILSKKEILYYNIILSNFSKIIKDTELKISTYTNISTSYPKIYHTLL